MLTTVLEFERPIIEKRKDHRLLRSSPTLALICPHRSTNCGGGRPTAEQIFLNLTPWQRALLRHPNRPYCLDYVDELFTDWMEIHGDRAGFDDAAIVCGLARLNGRPVVVIGQQKGRNTKDNLKRNFGMPRPDGYRKALRVMKLAARFNRPIITFIDTPELSPASTQKSVARLKPSHRTSARWPPSKSPSCVA